MLKLRWNSAIADLAEGHAQKCNTKHVNQHLPDGLYVGQNLYMSSGSKAQVANGVKAWIAEEKDFDFNTLTCRKSWEHCGHLTQVITAKTQWIGCAINRNCPGKWKTLMVCNYQPGNDVKSIIKGKACSGCPAATCDHGLCACNNPFCGKNGKVNIKTCKCQCNNPFIGEACQQKSCKPDPGSCGPEQPYGFPKSFCEGKYAAFTKKTCPVMCGVCDASAVKPAEKKPCPKPDSADCGKKRPWGFPKRFCKGMYRQFMARTCPKLCGVCK